MSDAPLSPGSQVRVRLVKNVHADVEYEAVVLADDRTQLVVRGPWAEREARDLGFVRFEPGDMFTEHYWRDRWYSVKEVRNGAGDLKGWYCDVARPVRVEGDAVVSVDLDLDLWVSADGDTILRLDEDEFAASGLAEADPAAAKLALDALAELERLAMDGFRGLDLSLTEPRIRTIVIGVAQKDDRVLAIEGFDSHKGERFYRPPGGGIEFGETGEAALRREFREELDADLESIVCLGTLENIFRCEGRSGHEIVLVYRIEVAHDERSTLDIVPGVESDGTPFVAHWLPLAAVRAGAARLYPDGLLELLDDAS